ncbi:MAG TPA: extracellular solute-binding protein, partial [Pseudomonas sp.]|nr:extracellular solute-binding protein [Pseudomonas sp.]
MFRCLAPLLLALTSGLVNAADTIRVYNWNDYIAPQVLADFTKATGIAVEYHTYSSAEELDKILKSGEKIDIAVPSHNDLPRLIKANMLQPLDFAQLPNRSHLDKQLLSKLAAVDPQNLHAVPYLWGAVGLAINTPKAEAAFGGPLPDSWSLLFDQAQSNKLASCGMSVLDAPDEVLSTLMNYQGNSFAHSSPGRIRRAGKVLDGLRPNLRYVDSERYIDDLNSGQLCVALAWVGDALTAAKAGQPVRFVVPQEGSVLFIDNLVIPSSASRADLAHKLINFLMQPQVAAQITSETLYPNGNADS